MRFFRIPSFTGIETHRDDADRGSLRVVEGCLPFGSGGLRSGPVWQNAGTVNMVSQTDENQLTASDDGNGNSALFVSRLKEVHDMALFTSEHTKVSFFVSTYSVVDPLNLYRKQRAVISPVGNRLFSFGDSDGEAVFIGKGPPAAQASVFPDETLYSYEWSRFPDCKFFVQGPKKTLFASGNPDKPLTVYISEPAGKTSPYRDAPYSTSNTNQNPGSMSTVDILGSNASVITALSTRGDQVIVHTDKGCHILYAPSSDQAETGYRVEQAPATNFSAAVNPQVVGGESGTMSFWLGHDGQIYKDESSSRGAEDKKSQADPDQASWKAKGIWEKELHHNLTESFATYDPQSGMYWFYVLSSEHLEGIKEKPPHTVIGVEAIPELPGNIDSLAILSEKPGKPLELVGLPELPGAVTDLDVAIITPPGQVKELEALPELPGTVLNLDAKPELPGQVNALSSTLEKPGTVQSVSAEPEFPGQVTGLTATADSGGSGPPECSGNNTHYWRWNGSSLVDINDNPFVLTNTLFYTYVSGFKHVQTPWNGVHESGGPFPNTQALAQSYKGTGDADTNIFWGSLPSQKPYSGGKSIQWDHSSGGSNGGPIYQMWHAFAPATVDVNGMREWEADYTAQGTSGNWNTNRTMKLFRNSATENMGINMMRGLVIDMSFVKVDNTDSCELTGVYHEINGANFMIYVGLRPQNLGSNRMGAYHQDGSLFELYV